MSDKRYYTPDLSDFHVGFEYEYLEVRYFDYKEQYERSSAKTEGLKLLQVESKSESIEHSIYKTECWRPYEYNEYQSAEDIRADIMKERIRVKHLDHDDIVAEGWKREASTQFSVGEFGDLKYIDLWMQEDGTVDIDVYEAEGRDNNRIDYSVAKSIRGISIRNRSELRLIMKMLGIKQQ